MRSGSGRRTLASILLRPLHRLRLAHAFMVDRHLGKLLAAGHGRIQRGHRLLIDHGDLGAADLPQLLLAHRPHVAALEEDLAGDDAAVRAHVLHDGERHGRLAAAGFTDDPLRLARHQLHVEVDDRGNLAGAGEIGDAEVAALQHRRLAGRRAHVVRHDGFSGRGHQSLMLISRRPSAIRLKPRMRLDTESAGMRSM